MGLFGGSTSRSGSAQKWAKPFAKAAAGTVQGVVADNAPGLQALTGQMQGLVPEIMESWRKGSPALDASQGYITDVLGGKYMGRADTNPQLEALIGRTTNDVQNAMGARFGARGSFGGTAHTQAESRGLADAILGLRYQDHRQQYQDESGELDRMASAAGMSPSIHQGRFAGLPEIMTGAGVAAEIPYSGINSLSGGLAALFQGGKSKTSGGLGSALLGGAGSLMSGLGGLGVRI